jgi:excisionase family DNA binding protein
LIQQPIETFAKFSNFIDEKTAAAYLGVEPGTLSVWRSTGRYQIPFTKVGRLVRYRTNVLDAWLQTRTRVTGSTE